MAAYDLIATYIVASRPHGVIYTGVTSDLLQRGLQHREGRARGFAAKYQCRLLVWWEQFSDMPSAIAREKQIKAWRRAWKVALIEGRNPVWRDLYEDFLLPPNRVPACSHPERPKAVSGLDPGAAADAEAK